VASSLAASIDTPGFSRPFTVNSRCARSVSCASSGSPSSTCAIVTGTKKAGRARSKMWVNPSGTMPMTSNGRPFSRTVRPTIDGSRSSSRTQ